MFQRPAANRSRPMFVLLVPLVSICVLLWTGCAHNPKLQPAGTAQRLADRETAAVGQNAGVRMVVDGATWRGDPSNLRDALLPVLVTIENNSPHPLRIDYQAFTLTGDEGFQQAALPPFRIGGTVSGPLVPVSPGFAYSRFYLHPGYSPFYHSGFYSWGGPWAWDPGWYGPAYAQWPVQLPTASMLEQAIPEGVVQPGGRVSGYLYFNRPGEHVGAVKFQAALINADTGEQFGVIQIPFNVQR